MSKQEYLERLLKALDEGRITEDAYDAAIENLEEFTDED